MKPDFPFYLDMLKVTSLRMLRQLDNKVFMKWISRYLVSDMKPSHVSIALYEPERGAFPIKVSTGKYRFPSHLVALGPTSPLLKPFLDEHRFADSVSCLDRLITPGDLKTNRVSTSSSIQEEMKRHRTEVCAKIKTHDQLAGCLLIGPREDGHPYTREDIDLFETLANDIAIEMERESYYHLSHFDSLTGLLSRNSLDHHFQTLIAEAQKESFEFGVALIDLDHFKKINDQFGHGVGDEVLRITAEIIKRDIRKSDLAFRYGGDELLLLLAMRSRNPNHPSPRNPMFREAIYRVLERLREKIAARPLNCLGHWIPVTASIGLSFYGGRTSQTQKDLIHEADQALYESKRRNRNRTSIFLNKQDES